MSAISLFFVPIIGVIIDLLTQFRSRFAAVNYFPVTADTPRCTDYTIIVPIYGNFRYLENIGYLDQYGSRVLLTTSQSETSEFYGQLMQVAREHGFRTHVSSRLPSPRERARDHLKARATGGTLRDTIVLDAHESITSRYVVCIDADTVTDVSLDYLVGAVEQADLDIASVVLTAANTDTLLARLQGHEYRLAMRIRRLMPWMISGACHVAKRQVHFDLMRKHSLFFQGNDIELGLLASLNKYRVGHVPFVVPTTVPSKFRSWFRQRKAWAGGEFRLMIINLPVARRHPFLYVYGAGIVLLLLPIRWYYLLRPSWPLLCAVVLYLAALVLANWKDRDWALLVYPFYSLLYTLFLVPVGVVAYAEMAVKFKNVGVITASRARHRATQQGQDRLNARAVASAYECDTAQP
jgi:cellulose synthase/poly-beta-1,6-N-acetylglucosamine synthase-like glycosyltransferase